MKIEHWEILQLHGVHRYAGRNGYEVDITEKIRLRFLLSESVEIELWIDGLPVYTNAHWLTGEARSQQELRLFEELASGLPGEDIVLRLARRNKDDELVREIERITGSL